MIRRAALALAAFLAIGCQAFAADDAEPVIGELSGGNKLPNVLLERS